MQTALGYKSSRESPVASAAVDRWEVQRWDDAGESAGEFGESLLSAVMLVLLSVVIVWLIMLLAGSQG